MSKGHHGAAGIVPVFLNGHDVGRLHRVAQHFGMVDQDAAAAVMRAALAEWEQTLDAKTLDSTDGPV